MKQKMIILGTAPCLESDLAAIKNHDEYDFLAVGLDCADRYLGRIEHAVSYHPKEFGDFRKRREKVGGNLDYETHTHCMPELGHRVWPYHPPSGSSAMLGIEVAMGLGYQKIICAGVALNEKPYNRFQKGWYDRVDKIRDKVRAMSGFPMELIGAPTDEWLEIKA